MEKGKKYIHYCWFGDHKISRLAKKCIKSWKRFLPDYEIVCWNEQNVDLNECPFIKEAYENKKWAFVADYVRAKAIYEYGGIYLDTDMKIVKNIDFLLKKDNFIGVEDSGAVAVGVWGAKKPGSKLAKELLDFYHSQKHFNKQNIYSYTIPVIVTNILNRYGFRKGETDIQELNNIVTVYPREYFYPLSYNYHNNAFSDNTCMIHYYDASWAPAKEKRDIWLIRKFGPKKAGAILKISSQIKAMLVYYAKVAWRTIEIITYPFRKLYGKFFVKKADKYAEAIKFVRKCTKDYVAITRDGWMGVGSSTKAMFGDVSFISDINEGDGYERLAEAIVDNKKIKTVIFSGFALGWEKLIIEIKNRNPVIAIKVFWHGSNAMHIEAFDWERFNCLFTMLDNKQIDQVAFAKESMYLQYKELGYNVAFLPNTFTVDSELKRTIKKEKRQGGRVRIGIYFSGDRWVKNFYNQIAAASIIKNSEVDIVPISPRVSQFAKLLKINLYGEEKNVSRKELLARIANDDVVLYATFVECAPILPLECLEMGVPCITGDNHHYWTNTPLEKYLIEPKVDNPVAIAKRAAKCIDNRDEIIKLYKVWKKDYDKKCKNAVAEFLKN